MTAGRESGGRPRQTAGRQRRAIVHALLLTTAGGALLLFLAALLLNARSAPGGPAPISRVDTADVHALAFFGSAERVILGHHHGVLESRDGGRSWTAWGAGSDAMGLGVAAGQPVVVAGHNVLAIASSDGGWRDIASDLPHTDIHGLARDGRDPQTMWAYLATGGLYESRDGGRHWQRVFNGHAFAVLAVDTGRGTRLIALDPEARGIVASDDGGRSWQLLGPPPTTPVYAMAAARGGETILFSGGEGLYRSDDGARSFALLLDLAEPILAIAVTDDGQTIVVATRDRAVYRSDDGGRSWPGGGP